MKCAAVKKLSAFWSPGGRENREPPRANDFLGETMPSLSLSKPSFVARKNKNEIQKRRGRFVTLTTTTIHYTLCTRPYTNNRPRQIRESATPVYTCYYFDAHTSIYNIYNNTIIYVRF